MPYICTRFERNTRGKDEGKQSEKSSLKKLKKQKKEDA